MKKKNFLKNVIFTIAFIFTFTISAQSDSEIRTAKDNPVMQAAPHLPEMLRSNDGDKLFYGVKYTYKADENEKTLKEWSVNYPNEVDSYKVAIAKYLNDTDVTKLSAADQNTFYDLKSQWLMATQLIN